MVLTAPRSYDHRVEWPEVSSQVRDLIRQGAELALDPPPAWGQELQDAIFRGPARGVIAEDPELAASTRRAIESTVDTWRRANLEHPGEPVAAGLSDETLDLVRDLVRRGLDDSALDAYRAGQNVVWAHWMELAFALTDDPAVLRELLAVSALSISSFVDVTLTALGEHVAAARQDLSRGRDAELREVVALIVQGAPISPARAAERLRYPLEREHWGLVVWSDAAEVDLASLDRVTHVASTPARGTSPLVVGASTSTRWVWTTSPPDDEAIADALSRAPQVCVAAAGPNPGVAGFRQSHLDALRTQRLVDGAPPERRLARYEDVALVALASQDPDGARRFVHHQLGALASAEASLRTTLRAYLRLHASPSATAEATFTHRNTVLRRVERARSLLPARTRDLPVEVAVALDLIEWGVVPEGGG